MWTRYLGKLNDFKSIVGWLWLITFLDLLNFLLLTILGWDCDPIKCVYESAILQNLWGTEHHRYLLLHHAAFSFFFFFSFFTLKNMHCCKCYMSQCTVVLELRESFKVIFSSHYLWCKHPKHLNWTWSHIKRLFPTLSIHFILLKCWRNLKIPGG